MRRRPLTTAAATLSALTALTACNGSPEAGQPNTTPTTTSATPTPTNTAPSTPTWSPEQQSAINAAKARYVAATAAADQAFAKSTTFNRAALEKAGIGGEWIIDLIDQSRSFTRSGWYQTGSTTIVSTKVKSVKLGGAQPEVTLSNCLDTSKLIVRSQKDDKPIPMIPADGQRHEFASRLVYAPPAPGGKKMWFLVSDESGAKC